MRQITDVHAFISEAQARADPLVASLVVNANGPTMALLTVYVARAELVRVAQERMPAGQWPKFLQQQAQLERVFDEQCEVLRKMSGDLIVLAGRGRS